MSDIIADILFASIMITMLTMVFAMLRAFWGPSVYDRILAVNMFGTKTVILIGILGYLAGRPAFLDIALVYAMMNFITTIAVLKYNHFTEPEVGGKSS